MKYNLTALDAFAKGTKLTDQTGLYGAEHAWYSPSTTCWVCLCGWEHSFRLYGFRPACSCLIVELLATQAKFLELFRFCDRLHLYISNKDAFFRPIGRGSRIHQLHLCRGEKFPNECSGYDIKQSDDGVPVILEFWGMRSTLLLPLLPVPLWSEKVAPDRVLSMGRIELFDT